MADDDRPDTRERERDRSRPDWAVDERADDHLEVTPEDGQAQSAAPGPDPARPGRREATHPGR